MIHYDFPLVPFLFATALSVNGLRKRSLSPSGAAAAFLTGISMLSMPLRTPGISLIVFYLIGSSATRAGKKEKALLEDGHDKAGAGYRNGMQVFSNSASALVAALLWGALHAPGFPAARQVSRALGAHLVNYTPDAWCPLDASANQGWSRALLMIVLGCVFVYFGTEPYVQPPCSEHSNSLFAVSASSQQCRFFYSPIPALDYAQRLIGFLVSSRSLTSDTLLAALVTRSPPNSASSPKHLQFSSPPSPVSHRERTAACLCSALSRPSQAVRLWV